MALRRSVLPLALVCACAIEADPGDKRDLVQD
jgi:hypothetical protein